MVTDRLISYIYCKWTTKDSLCAILTTNMLRHLVLEHHISANQDSSSQSTSSIIQYFNNKAIRI
jgi:hypothetical protein